MQHYIIIIPIILPGCKLDKLLIQVFILILYQILYLEYSQNGFFFLIFFFLINSLIINYRQNIIAIKVNTNFHIIIAKSVNLEYPVV